MNPLTSVALFFDDTMRAGQDMARVLTRCAASGRVVATHAQMTVTEFQKFKGALYFWCSPCRAAHDQGVNLLWLEGLEPVDERERREGPKHQQGAEDADPRPSNDPMMEVRKVGVR